MRQQHILFLFLFYTLFRKENTLNKYKFRKQQIFTVFSQQHMVTFMELSGLAEGFVFAEPTLKQTWATHCNGTLKTGHADVEPYPFYRHRENGLAH